jgi:hypothetical protein
VPAAAVIPAPIAYINVAAVKKLVVGFLTRRIWPATVTCVSAGLRLSLFLVNLCVLRWACKVARWFTLKKLECLKQAFCYEYISME